MDLGSLKRTPGSVKNKRRVGRGPGSGRGKTSGRGHKGQKARSGFKSKPYSEGGQMPLQRRLPKKGFTNVFKTAYQPVNLDALGKIQSETITPEDIYRAGLAGNHKKPVKILGQGEIDRALNISAHAFSKTAVRKIEAAGGKAEVVK